MREHAIDNFPLMEQFFDDPHFKDNCHFLHANIALRSKDHPGRKVSERTITFYTFKSYKELLSRKEEIMYLCEHYGARAYISLSPKKYEKVNRRTLATLAELAQTKTFTQTDSVHLLKHIIGAISGSPKRWVIDIDNDEDKLPVLKTLSELDAIYKTETSVYAFIPTHAGEHIITSPFNRDAFAEKMPNIDVHPNSMGTMLYFPSSIEDGNAEWFDLLDKKFHV